MPDLLLELFSEEIPARMQAQAAEDLRKLVTNALVERGLTYEGAKAFATPRRLALNIVGLPARQPDTREERKGPRVGSPEGAVLGFLKSAGLSDISQAKIESDPKKGEFYVAVIEKSGRATIDVLAEVIPAVIRAFPWPKSMRWGERSAASGSLRWVRPLRSILATFGPENEETEVVPFEVDGIRAGNITYGHRFMKPDAIQVRRFEDYVAKLETAKVVLDAERRKAIIRTDAQNLAFAQGFELVEDEALLNEVAGLVEWPVVLMGSFEAEFLDVPAEVVRATIRANQKCFVLKSPTRTGKPSDLPPMGGGEGSATRSLPQLGGVQGGGTLANRFLLTANIIPSDGGAVIIAGNERVIRARLSDAKFFWDTDRKVWAGYKDEAKLDAALNRFKSVTFHEKLGSQHDRIERISALATELCKVTGADVELVKRAAKLCKLDLQTEVVGEFPEVQGLMGRTYATLIGAHPSVAAACEEHYKPVGPTDFVPTDKVSITIALADKLDTLVGFWAIDEKPTGSKDPYALRRAALGVIRLIVENGVRVGLLRDAFGSHVARIFGRLRLDQLKKVAKQADELSVYNVDDSLIDPIFDALNRETSPQGANAFAAETKEAAWEAISNLLAFFHDRLKVMLRDSGARHDLVDAVLANGESNDDLLLVVRRVEALGKFLETEDGVSLLAGFKRAANILRAEEKKDGEGAFEAAANPALLVEASEKALHEALSTAGEAAAIALEKQDFAAAMRAMSRLRAPVDAFFEGVMVNSDDPAIRANRLALLAALRRVTRQVADFSKISG